VTILFIGFHIKKTNRRPIQPATHFVLYMARKPEANR
jgi:hypothetical protein